MPNLDTVLEENRRLAAEMIEAENRLLRESLAFCSGYVDPRDAYRGPDGEFWPPLDVTTGDTPLANTVFADEHQLARARNIGRLLEQSNEFAINGHENRINYIVGTGHTYKVVAKKGVEASAAEIQAAQEIVDAFVRVNRWQQRQQEIVRRRDRDGEVFLRLFVAPDGVTRVRFIEPSQVFRPQEVAARAEASFGIETEPDDVETVRFYWVDGQPVAADEIQHRKLGVDSNVKRGVPLFYPVRKNLRRAEKLLQNMATVSDIQTAIAMIRRHDRLSKPAARTFRDETADASLQEPGKGSSTHFQYYAAGTILDAPKTTDYVFPAAGLDASRYVQVLQAILRSVASRLVFPEFMLTSDASNANYSSTLVAEGPAVKMFQRWQAEMRGDDLAIMHRTLDVAVRTGRLPASVRERVDIQVGMPRVTTRDEKQEAEVNEIYFRLGIKSPQTIAAELGLDHAQEQSNLAAIRNITRTANPVREN